MDIFFVAPDHGTFGGGPAQPRSRLIPRVAVGREPRELHHVGFDELDVLAY